jgi:hypothetical protein
MSEEIQEQEQETAQEAQQEQNKPTPPPEAKPEGMRTISEDEAREIIQGKQGREQQQQPAVETENQPEGNTKPEEVSETANEQQLPEDSQAQPNALSDERAAIENQIFQITNGKTKNVKDYVEMTKGMGAELEELKNKKPVVNAETIKAYNAKLKEEKGYDLGEALKWQNTDIDAMNQDQKLDYALRIENPDMSEAWYKDRKERLNLSAMDENQLKDIIDDGDYTQREIKDLQLERENLLHKSQKLLKDYKESFDFNINFEGNANPNTNERQVDPERVAKIRADMSQAIGEVENEMIDIDLPMSLGKTQLEVRYTEAEKNPVIDTVDPSWAQNRYGNEDGSVDFSKMMRDRFRMMNYESTVKRAVESGIAAYVKKYEASRDNIQTNKEKPTSTQSGDTMGSQLRDFMKGHY